MTLVTDNCEAHAAFDGQCFGCVVASFHAQSNRIRELEAAIAAERERAVEECVAKLEKIVGVIDSLEIFNLDGDDYTEKSMERLGVERSIKAIRRALPPPATTGESKVESVRDMAKRLGMKVTEHDFNLPHGPYPEEGGLDRSNPATTKEGGGV